MNRQDIKYKLKKKKKKNAFHTSIPEYVEIKYSANEKKVCLTETHNKNLGRPNLPRMELIILKSLCIEPGKKIKSLWKTKAEKH